MLTSVSSYESTPAAARVASRAAFSTSGCGFRARRVRGVSTTGCIKGRAAASLSLLITVAAHATARSAPTRSAVDTMSSATSRWSLPLSEAAPKPTTAAPSATMMLVSSACANPGFRRRLGASVEADNSRRGSPVSRRAGYWEGVLEKPPAPSRLTDADHLRDACRRGSRERERQRLVLGRSCRRPDRPVVTHSSHRDRPPGAQEETLVPFVAAENLQGTARP